MRPLRRALSLETPLQSGLMRRLGKVLERLLGPILPSRPEGQPTQPTESAPAARRSRPVPPSVASPAAEANTSRKPRRQMTMPNTRQFAEFDHRLPTQSKPADSPRKAKFQ